MTMAAETREPDVDTFEVDSLTRALRARGGKAWSPVHVRAAYQQLTSALHGDEALAVEYLEWMAERNIYLFRWIASPIGHDALRAKVERTLKKTAKPTVATLTLDELLLAALTADSAYERIEVMSRAMLAHLEFAPIVCLPHNQLFTFRDFCFLHLSPRENTPRQHWGEDDDPASSAHGVHEVRAATDADIARRARTGRPL